MKLTLVLGCVLACSAIASACMLTFTGNAHTDFYAASQDPSHPCELYKDPQNQIQDYSDDSPERHAAEPRDVGVPDFFVGHAGWDMRGTFVSWCVDTDALQVGIDCYGICGDPDNDGDPDNTDPTGAMALNSGFDIANMQMTETILFILDIDQDNFDFDVFSPPYAFGWPSAAFAQSNFGLYVFDPAKLSSPISGIVYDDPTFADGQTHPIPWNITDLTYSHDNNSITDVEFTINQFSELPGFPEDWNSAIDGIYLQFESFAGSFQDDGVGEEVMPSDYESSPYSVPGCILDECGECDGPPVDDCGLCSDHPMYNNSRDPDCNQCQGVGPDDCGICPGFNGYNQPLDMCNKCPNEDDYGVCDCCGCDDVPFSGLVFDQCDECGGTGSSCCTPESYKGVDMWDIDRMLVYYEVHHTLMYVEMLEASMWNSITSLFEYEWVWSSELTEPVPFCDALEALMVFEMCCMDFVSEWVVFVDDLDWAANWDDSPLV